MAFGWQGNFGFRHPYECVPTADGRILKGGTAYQSDLGMTGPRESVLGRDIDACLGRFWMVCLANAPLPKGMWACRVAWSRLRNPTPCYLNPSSGLRFDKMTD